MKLGKKKITQRLSPLAKEKRCAGRWTEWEEVREWL